MKKNVFITILVILVLGLGGYLVYDKVIESDVKEESNDVENVKQYDLVEAKKLVDKYTLNNGMFWEGIFDFGITEDDKIFIAIMNTKPTNIDYTCEEAFPGYNTDELPNQYEIEKDGFWGNCYEDYSIYTYDNINKTYKELFGSEKELPKKMVSAVYYRYAYSEKYNSYIELSCECGGGYEQFTYYDVSEVTQKGDTLDVTMDYIKYVFDEYNNEVYVYPNNYNISVNYDVLTGLTEEQMKSLYSRTINESTENGIQKYKFTFKKSDTGYYLESITKQVY